jgi:hypothetical protein
LPERKNMLYRTSAAACALLVAACGPGNDGTEAGAGRPAEDPVRYLVVEDSIGEGMGDSACAFGTVEDMCHGPGDEVLVLDGIANRIGRYSPGGEFLNWIAGEGEGPGEILGPSDMVLTADGCLAVNDLARSRVTFYGQDGSVLRDIQGFVPFPPTRLRASTAGLVGTRRDFDREANRYGFRVGLWTDSPQSDLIYHSRMTDFDRENIQRTVSSTNIALTASPVDGRVYVAPVSTTDYRILIYAADGTREGEISMERPRVRRPQAEIDRESEERNRQLREEGAPPDMVWEPREYENQIAALWVGPENRLWVRDGTSAQPLFHVYSPRGEKLFDCSLAGGSTGDGLSFAIDAGGFLATQTDPLDFPRVYILSLQDEQSLEGPGRGSGNAPGEEP